MFVRNLRQRLLVCPVRGRVILSVDPGFHHGCKLAVLSPTSKNDRLGRIKSLKEEIPKYL